MTGLMFLLPELVLAGMSLALILVARHIRRAQPAAAVVVFAAIGAAVGAG
ncbi:MAG: hypothetical protein HY654_00035, partial [Acidobacteria bacterium]|nr:hypothetical protein [Acidobacteriota bacterium]